MHPIFPASDIPSASLILDTDLAVRAEHMLRFMDAMGMERAKYPRHFVSAAHWQSC